MNKASISIVGTGKIAKSLCQALACSSTLPPEIARRIQIIRRKRTNANLSFFRDYHVRMSKNIQFVAKSEYIILAVTPKGAGPILSKLKRVSFASDRPYTLISFVSGLSREQIKEALPKDAHINVIAATCNTNFVGGHALIAATDHHAFFTELSEYVWKENEEEILKSVFTIGTMNGLIYKALSLALEADGVSGNISKWLRGLSDILRENKFPTALVSSTATVSIGYEALLKFQSLMTGLLAEQPLFYRYDKAKDRVYRAFQSSLHALITYRGTVTTDTVESFMKSVITKGGCTEKGITALRTVEDLQSAEYLAEHVCMPIILTLATFPGIVKESIKNPNLFSRWPSLKEARFHKIRS